MKTIALVCSLGLLGVASGLAADTTPLSLVNPLMGTENPQGLSKGITIPAVALPFPMNAWTPSTSSGAEAGYDYPRTKINAFRQRHLHTSRMGDFANIALMPVFGLWARAPANGPPIFAMRRRRRSQAITRCIWTPGRRRLN